jgi:hypothetical protein
MTRLNVLGRMDGMGLRREFGGEAGIGGERCR